MKPAASFALLLCLVLPVVPAAQSRSAVPAPEATFGFEPGADYKLATYDQSIEYFRKLDAASNYVTLVEAGRTTRGRPMYFALISSPDNLAHVERYRRIAQRLAHPGDVTEAEARRLASEGKAFVHIDGGLHATEVGGPQHAPVVAYELVSRASQPETKAILDNVVLMLWPTINPDGQQAVAEWYMKNVGTPYELSEVPTLYQEYAGHDNNRDAYMLNMIESRVIEHAWRQWEPQIVYVHHQSGPFPTRIWLPPFSEPIGSEAPYLMTREVNMMGMAIAKRLEEHGQIGATHMGTAFDAWYPGYIDYAPTFKNVAAFWTETALYQFATPHDYTLQDFPESMRDLRPRSLYSSPWPPGRWRLKDAVDYMTTASYAVLDFAAKYKDTLLLDRYQAGRDQIARGATKPPFAYVFPQEQRDPMAAVELLRRLAFGGVRVSQLTASATIDGASYPAGTWIVPTDQEFAAIAREVLDVQRYPDVRRYPGGPPERPYDAAGWSLPLQMGVRVVAAATALTPEARNAMKPVGGAGAYRRPPAAYPDTKTDAASSDSVPGAGFDTDPAAAAIVPPPGRLTGTGTAVAVDPAQNNAFRAINLAWKRGAMVRFVRGSSTSAARYVIEGLGDAAAAVSSLALNAERTDAKGAVVSKPRIGVYEPWGGNMDAGWTRWVLEQYGFDFTVLRPADFHSPLSARVDVLVLPDQARFPLAGGVPRGPLRELRPEYADVLTPEDLAAFEAFVRTGGTLVCLNTASNFVVQQFKLPVKNVASGLRPEDFFLHGSIVEASIDSAHPVMAGMPEKAALFADNSPIFETLDGFEGTVLARYAATGSPLLSGYLIGERYLQRKAAALDVQVGDGHVILLGFRPQWRGQPFGTFRVLFNAVLNVH